MPMAVEMLSVTERKDIKDSEKDIGYAYVQPGRLWNPQIKEETVEKPEWGKPYGHVKPDSEVSDIKGLQTILNTLIFDTTFVDRNNKVEYFSGGEDRLFARNRTIIIGGGFVKNRHPPASIHIVEKLMGDFKAGRKDYEDFLIKMKDKFIYIRYFAVRDENREYLDVLQVTQDVSGIRQIEGEIRLAD
jgi:hypothetical protein